MSKFKVGDKVRVKDDLVTANLYNGFNFANGMEQYKGKEAIITSDNHYYSLDIDEGDWSWTDGMIEGLIYKETEYKIGARVEIIKNLLDNPHVEIGYKGTISDIDSMNLDYCVIKFDNKIRGWGKDSKYWNIDKKRFKLIEDGEEKETKLNTTKYVRCIDNSSVSSILKKGEIYTVIDKYYNSETNEYYYELQGKGRGWWINRFEDVKNGENNVKNTDHTPTLDKQKGKIKYKIENNVTTVKINGKIGKATKNPIDKVDNKIGILIATARALGFNEEKVQGIINVLFDDNSKAEIERDNITI